MAVQLHVPSLTVFSNWPSSKTPLHYVSALDFSPNSGTLARMCVCRARCRHCRRVVVLFGARHVVLMVLCGCSCCRFLDDR